MDIEIKSPFYRAFDYPKWLPVDGDTMKKVFDDTDICEPPFEIFYVEYSIVRDLALAGF